MERRPAYVGTVQIKNGRPLTYSAAMKFACKLADSRNDALETSAWKHHPIVNEGFGIWHVGTYTE